MKFTRDILSEIDREIENLPYRGSERNNLSTALFKIALDHSKSIIVLLENALYPSAYALARPMFESFVRAAWIQHCATDAQIEKIIKSDEFPLYFGQMLEEVEKCRNWTKTLSGIKKNAMSNMHSYTHGGMQIITRMFSGGDLVFQLDQQEINDLFKFIALVSFLSFNEIVLIANTTDKDAFIKQLYGKIESQYFKQKK